MCGGGDIFPLPDAATATALLRARFCTDVIPTGIFFFTPRPDERLLHDLSKQKRSFAEVLFIVNL